MCGSCGADDGFVTDQEEVFSMQGDATVDETSRHGILVTVKGVRRFLVVLEESSVMALDRADEEYLRRLCVLQLTVCDDLLDAFSNSWQLMSSAHVELLF